MSHIMSSSCHFFSPFFILRVRSNFEGHFGNENMKKLGEDNQGVVAIWDCGSPLYDSHELASLSHLIERNTMSLPFLCSTRFAIATSVVGSNQGHPIKRDDEDHQEIGFDIADFGGIYTNPSRTHQRMTNDKSKIKNTETAKKLNGFYGFFSGISGLFKK